MRDLFIVLGDQLNRDSAVFAAASPTADALWMAETAQEAGRCHQSKLVFFFAAMRHFRDAVRAEGFTVHYHALTPTPSADRGADFAAILRADLPTLRPERLLAVWPGDFRVKQQLDAVARELAIPLVWLPDHHFYSAPTAFAAWTKGRKQWRMEHFYQRQRQEHGILLTADGKPEGGAWNFDADNRASFGPSGPPTIPPPFTVAPDAITRDVISLVTQRFHDHPGSAADFAMPVTAEAAQTALDEFIAHRLPQFGRFEDALWTRQPWLYHSRLSALLNVKLLNPRTAVQAAVTAYREGHAPLNSVEGFVRQILGWREFVRGIYWQTMPGYAEGNALNCAENREVPTAFWDGKTDLPCVADAMESVLRYGYAHHIQRLMILGLWAQLLGVHPYRFHQWHMAMYLDAIDWVSLPNTLGMSQYGDGGLMASKPYCASGAYIQRMSNYCSRCAYRPTVAVGKQACPFTTLYWDFLGRHAEKFQNHPRMALQIKNWQRKSAEEQQAIQKHADAWRDAVI